MALALNVFKTIAQNVPQIVTEVYTAPIGYTGVVLLAQVTNIGSGSQDITFVHRRTISSITYDTEILKTYPIAGLDTLNLISGKLVLEPGDKLVISGTSNTDLKLVISILETLN